MRYILIDPLTETISEVEHPGQVDWRTIKAALGDKWIELAGTLPNGDTLWVDEEGLLNGPNHFFSMPSANAQALAGRGVIVGPEEMPPGATDPDEAVIVAARTPLADVQAAITWLDRMAATKISYKEHHLPGLTVFEQKTTIEPA